MQPSDPSSPTNPLDAKFLEERERVADPDSIDANPTDSRDLWDGLPEPIRFRIADLASEAIAEIPLEKLPAPIRPVVNFAPAKRARAGARLLVSNLRESLMFRALLVEWLKEHHSLTLSLEQSDAVNAAAAALLLGDPSAQERIWLVGEHIEHSGLRFERDNAIAASRRLEAEVARLREELKRAREEVRAAREERHEELDKLRGRLREQGMLLRQAKDALEVKGTTQHREIVEYGVEVADLRAQLDRERQRVLAERARADRAASDAQAVRQIVREARDADEMRLSLLLETMEQALAGLRRELSLSDKPISQDHPADHVAGVRSGIKSGQELPDVQTLSRLLMVPNVHVIIDGYNVTKTGYPSLTLAEQRERLSQQLSVFAARQRCEVTVVFDGAGVGTSVSVRKGVRVLFSDPGVLADDVIRSLVFAEPQGRPIIVVTSDREIVDSVRHRGAHAVASALFLTALG